MPRKPAAAKPTKPTKPTAPKRGRGQPTVWTPELEKAILNTLKTGCSFRDAAELNGISYETLKARQRTDPEYSALLSKERLKFKVGSLGLIAKAAAKSWTAAAWWLERTHPEEYGRRRVEISGIDGGALKIDAELTAGQEIRASPKAMEKLHDALLAAAGEKKAP